MTRTAPFALVGFLAAGALAADRAPRIEGHIASEDPVRGWIAIADAAGKGTLSMDPDPLLTSGSIVRATAIRDPLLGGPALELTLSEAAVDRIRAATAANLGRRFAILVDGKVVTAPIIQTTMGQGPMITGLDEAEVQRLAALLGAQQDADPASGPGSERAAPARRATVVLPSGSRLDAEVMATREERERGLMFRSGLPEGRAMVFLFEAPDVLRFWMKNVSFSIDLVWMDAEGRVVHVEGDLPPCPGDPCPTFGPEQKANVVVALHHGTAAKERLGKGDRIAIVGADRDGVEDPAERTETRRGSGR